MTEKLFSVGCSISSFILETYPREFLSAMFSEDMGIDDLVDQILLELVKYAYDNTRERHSVRYYLTQAGLDTEDNAMRFSRLLKLSNECKEKVLDYYESIGFDMEGYRPPKMQDIKEKLDGYSLSEMDMFELTQYGEIKLIKAIANFRLGNTNRVSNNEFREIAEQYDKLIISLMEQCLDSDEKMVFNSLAYFTLEAMYAFDFIYQCAVSLLEQNITDPNAVFSKIDLLLGMQISPEPELPTVLNSRMVGYRERLIPMFLCGNEACNRYESQLLLLTLIKENQKIDGVPITQWFIENTDIHDWASFFRDYDVFRCRVENKDYSNQVIRIMRGLINLIFPENPEKRYYNRPDMDGTIETQLIQEVFSMVKINCYIEEYHNDEGGLCARLRDKETNKRVVILGNEDVIAHFLRFLQSAKKHAEIMPTVFCREGTDIVAVRGTVANEDADSIEIALLGPGAGYLFQ